MADEVLLGEITCPSGTLVLLDGGYLGLWSGERAGGRAVDFEVHGPDAVPAARTFDRGPGLALYDVPAHWAPGFAAMFRRHCAERGLDATLTAHPRQIPHRDRARRAIAAGRPDFPMMGVPVVPVGAVPPDRPLPVTATPAEYGWLDIVITLSDHTPVARRSHGAIGVDNARLACADADALSAWVHDDPLDGRADLVVRGPDGSRAAPDAAALPGDGGQGWLDLPFDQAVSRALDLEDYAEHHPDRRFAVDLRPHSHQWQLMSRVRASPVEAATLDVGGATMLVAMTTTDDGMLPVELATDASGAPVEIRVRIRPADRPLS
ncbi:hypothetical protein [Symbioplanes lichenis]|uniref:hypothetical protein n=1 Tax=Symbioplanes lichenis TaxID=1629072 RepID=UPI0027393499|nr:hypothetical protein [Actinoplanes lichenis]